MPRRSATRQAHQRSPLSPLLSNVVLDELYKELEARGLELRTFTTNLQSIRQLNLGALGVLFRLILVPALLFMV